MSRRAPAECRARAGGGDAPGRRERTAPVELRSLDLLNGVRRQPLGYNRPTVQALPYSTIPRVYEVEIVTISHMCVTAEAGRASLFVNMSSMRLASFSADPFLHV